jgi:histidine triad (HIT) family protein
LDIKPVNPGHILVIPKTHYASMLETPDAVAASLMAVVPSLGKAMLAATQAEGYNVGVNTGRAAGQIIDHVHLHIMPRRTGDGYELWHGHAYANPEAMHAMANAIRSAL